jgi:mitochondrial import inner membrane translocase subunit TIM23
MSVWDALTGHKSNKPGSDRTRSLPSDPDRLPPSASEPPSLELEPRAASLPRYADPAVLHPLAGLQNDTLEYLTLDDAILNDVPGAQTVIPSRGFTDDLCYGTGVTYLTALSLGGAWGLQEGLRRSVNQPPKLRLNSVLNAVTRRGPFLGNSAGVVAICYNCFNSLIGNMRGKHDSANSIAAGALSGMLFKSTRGVRPMLISGGIVASVAGVWAVSLSITCVLVCGSVCIDGELTTNLCRWRSARSQGDGPNDKDGNVCCHWLEDDMNMTEKVARLCNGI